ncbi:MAG: prepilin-type N-terminal cleavage/methylation domain-containing protein [Candidatus Paceibacterota bacterium]
MSKKGFTLVELMVVVGILSIIMLVISQPLVSVIKYQRESQTADNMRDNIQFVMNKMEKELKTSSNVTKVTNDKITFTDQNGDDDPNVEYRLDTNEIKRNNQKLTDSSIFKVTKLNFNKNANGLVTISISAQSLDSKDNVTMQTSVLPLNN